MTVQHDPNNHKVGRAVFCCLKNKSPLSGDFKGPMQRTGISFQVEVSQRTLRREERRLSREYRLSRACFRDCLPLS